MGIILLTLNIIKPFDSSSTVTVFGRHPNVTRIFQVNLQNIYGFLLFCGRFLAQNKHASMST